MYTNQHVTPPLKLQPFTGLTGYFIYTHFKGAMFIYEILKLSLRVIKQNDCLPRRINQPLQPSMSGLMLQRIRVSGLFV